MNSRKKIIYIVIILVCAIGSAIILLWGGGGNTSAPGDLTLPPSPSGSGDAIAPSAQIVRPGPDGSYPPPAVFPANTKLDTSLFSSSDFQILKPNNPTKLDDGELGRDDPFAKY